MIGGSVWVVFYCIVGGLSENLLEVWNFEMGFIKFFIMFLVGNESCFWLVCLFWEIDWEFFGFCFGVFRDFFFVLDDFMGVM